MIDQFKIQSIIWLGWLHTTFSCQDSIHASHLINVSRFSHGLCYQSSCQLLIEWLVQLYMNDGCLTRTSYAVGIYLMPGRYCISIPTASSINAKTIIIFDVYTYLTNTPRLNAFKGHGFYVKIRRSPGILDTKTTVTPLITSSINAEQNA